MISTTLEKHLAECAKENSNFNILYSTWESNKQKCANSLKTVLLNYPHFSIHDADHADTVISNIEMLLGEDRIKQLSPTDTWLLLHAAYTHDLGMVIEWKEVEKAWASDEFQDFLSGLEESKDRDLCAAVKWIRNIKEDKAEPEWPLTTYRYVNLLKENYFRNRHAQLSRKHIDLQDSELQIDLGQSNLIQRRLILLLGQICEMHTAPTDYVLELEFETNGYSSDYAHPRFVAMMLRLGDLLDVDNGRFNPTFEIVSGEMPESSVPHKESNESTRHILITPKEIQFTSDCPNFDAYLQTRNFVAWLENEIDFLTKYWSKIVPENIGGIAPRFDVKNLYINGVPDVDDIADLRFRISQEKAFDIIEGSNIYNDKLIFTREFLQNAMDASKIQLWDDLLAGTYSAWIEKPVDEKLQPYDIKPDIYKNYPIRINVKELENGMLRFSISDSGTGISVESFKRMCNVGESNSEYDKIRKKISKMPVWLRPTAGFGIGMQSVFMITDKITVETNDGSNSYTAVIPSYQAGGYLRIQRDGKRKTRGTKMTVEIPDKLILRTLSNFEMDYFDPAYNEALIKNKMKEHGIINFIKGNCQASFFPVRITYIPSFSDKTDEAEITDSESRNKPDIPAPSICTKKFYEAVKSSQNIGNCRYLLSPDYNSITIWDKENYVYCELELQPDYFENLLNHIVEYLFKGNRISDYSLSRLNYFNATIDFYGMEAKEALNINRKKLTGSGEAEAEKITEAMIEFYKARILEAIKKKETELTEGEPDPDFSKFYLFSFWSICDNAQRNLLPEAIMENYMDRKSNVYSYENGQVVPEKEKTFSIIQSAFKNYFFVGSIRYKINNDINITAFLKTPLDQNKDLQNCKFICDPELQKSISFCFVKRFTVINNNSDETDSSSSFSCVEISPKENTLIECADDNTRKLFIYRLVPRKFVSVSETHNIRTAIPAIKEYNELYISREAIPFGVYKDNSLIGNYRCYYIISPFTLDFAECPENMSEEDFIKAVENDDSFPKLVDYVLKYEPNGAVHRTKEGIKEQYGDLISEYYKFAKDVETQNNKAKNQQSL